MELGKKKWPWRWVKKTVPCTLTKAFKDDLLVCRQPGPNFDLASNSDLTCLPAADESQDFGLNAKLENLLLIGGLRNYLPFEGRLKNPKLSDLPIKKAENARDVTGCEFQMSREGYPPTSLFVAGTQTNGYHQANVIYGDGEENRRRLNCRVSEALLSKHSCFKAPPASANREGTSSDGERSRTKAQGM